MGAQIVADLGHDADRRRVDHAGGPRAGAVRFGTLSAVRAGERLGHLAAAGVLETDEQQPHRPALLCVLFCNPLGHLASPLLELPRLAPMLPAGAVKL